MADGEPVALRPDAAIGPDRIPSGVVAATSPEPPSSAPACADGLRSTDRGRRRAAPSIWYAEVAMPKRKSSGNDTLPADGFSAVSHPVASPAAASLEAASSCRGSPTPATYRNADVPSRWTSNRGGHACRGVLNVGRPARRRCPSAAGRTGLMYPIRRQLVGEREAKRVVDPHPVEISGQKGHSRATTDAVINAVVDSGPTESWPEEP